MGMLEIEDLSAGYLSGPDVLHGAHLTVRDGEVVALVGLNGAGKSTLVRAIFGLLPARTGRIVFDGADITIASCDARARRGLMLVPEGRELCLSMTVAENLSLGSLALTRAERRRSGAEIRERIMTLFPILGSRSRQTAGTMSGGQQQMLAIARALMAKPRLLILDEPSLGLAPQLVGEIFDSLSELNRDGLAILLVEQNAEIAGAFSSRSYALELGRVSETDRAVTEQGARGVLHDAGGESWSRAVGRAGFRLPEFRGVHLPRDGSRGD
jgi:branched-chain amino acid transport system ATP-binding protein